MKVSKIITASEMADITSTAIGLSADFSRRHLYLIGEITPELLYRFLISFHMMDICRGPITITLSSAGGNDSDGWAIYDTVQMANNDVTIVGLGTTQSIAALILQAGDRRLLTPQCRFMIHNGSLSLGHRDSIHAATVVAMSKEVQISIDRYHKALSDRSGCSMKEIRKFCRKETFFDAKSAVKNGFADGILMPDQSVLTRTEIE